MIYNSLSHYFYGLVIWSLAPLRNITMFKVFSSIVLTFEELLTSLPSNCFVAYITGSPLWWWRLQNFLGFGNIKQITWLILIQKWQKGCVETKFKLPSNVSFEHTRDLFFPFIQWIYTHLNRSDLFKLDLFHSI